MYGALHRSNTQFDLIRIPYAKDAQHIGDTFDMSAMGARWHFSDGIGPNKTTQVCRGMVTVKDARKLFGRLEVVESKRQQHLPPRVFRAEAFSAVTAGIASIQKNPDFARAGMTGSMVAELREVDASNREWHAIRMVAIEAEEARLAQLGTAVEEVVVEKRLAYGEVLDYDDGE
jgi:hypothetical protein